MSEANGPSLTSAGYQAVREIAICDSHHRDALTFEFLRICWPSLRAQNQ
jgi:hypothetical protein